MKLLDDIRYLKRCLKKRRALERAIASRSGGIVIYCQDAKPEPLWALDGDLWFRNSDSSMHVWEENNWVEKDLTEGESSERHS